MSTSLSQDMCCGGTRPRIGCTYHDPALQPASQVVPDGTSTVKVTLSGGVTFAGHVPQVPGVAALPQLGPGRVLVAGVSFTNIRVNDSSAAPGGLVTLFADKNDPQVVKLQAMYLADSLHRTPRLSDKAFPFMSAHATYPRCVFVGQGLTQHSYWVQLGVLS